MKIKILILILNNTLKNITFEYFNEYFLNTMIKLPSKIMYEL